MDGTSGWQVPEEIADVSDSTIIAFGQNDCCVHTARTYSIIIPYVRNNHCKRTE